MPDNTWTPGDRVQYNRGDHTEKLGQLGEVTTHSSYIGDKQVAVTVLFDGDTDPLMVATEGLDFPPSAKKA